MVQDRKLALAYYGTVLKETACFDRFIMLWSVWQERIPLEIQEFVYLGNRAENCG